MTDNVGTGKGIELCEMPGLLATLHQIRLGSQIITKTGSHSGSRMSLKCKKYPRGLVHGKQVFIDCHNDIEQPCMVEHGLISKISPCLAYYKVHVRYELNKQTVK